MNEDEIRVTCEKHFKELGAKKLNYNHLENVGH